MSLYYFDPFFEALDSSGVSIAGATLDFFETNTTTRKDTFQEAALSTPNTNPVVADGAGRYPEIYLQASLYTIVFKDADGVTIKTIDDFNGAGSGVGSGDMLAANNLSDVDSAATSATNLGLGTGDTPTFAGVNLGDENLDHYDEGSWTPTLGFATPGDESIAYTFQVGRYVRIGNYVFAFFNIITSTFTHTTASGSLEITGLPFTVSNIASTEPIIGLGKWRGITKANFTDMGASPLSNSTLLHIHASGSAQNSADIATGDMPSAGAVELYGWAIFSTGLS